jgi:hypothetical protein
VMVLSAECWVLSRNSNSALGTQHSALELP